mgnify:CR=1 FL=1
MKALIKKHLFDGKFEIQGEIAKGQTGTILYGYDIGLRQEVAIKIYHSQINGRLIRGKTFVEKSKPLLRLDHPNLLKIFKVEEEGDTAVVFMEFFDAPSLQQLIHDKGKLSVQDMLILAREIAEVLVHTHFQGIIHGTLHPGHVLVGPQGQIKVMDLGLSWLIMDILADGDEEVLRPLPYFPPEIAKEELLNLSSDLYSLGFMMYEMVTGTVPYAGLPKTSIMGKLSFDQADPTFDFPATMPTAICDLIRKMTRNKTEQRLQDATHVLTVISQQLSKLPLSKTSKFLPPEAPQPQAPTQEESTEPTKTSRTPLPSASPEPSLTRTPQVQRPKSSVDYGQDNSTAKTGIILTLIVVVGLAGGLGYWYRDALEPYISGGLTQLDHLSGEMTQEQPIPAKQSHSPTLPQDIPNTSKPLVETPGTVERLNNNVLPVDKQKKSTVKPGAQPTERATKTAPQPNEPNVQQSTRSREAQPNEASASRKKQPIAPTSSTPVQQQPAKTDQSIPKIAPLRKTQATKITPVQKSQTKANMSSVPIQRQSRKTTPVAPKLTPPSKTRATKVTPVQKLSVKPPSTNSQSQRQPGIPGKKQTKSNSAAVPIQQEPAQTTPTSGENAPRLSPNSKTTKSGNLQKSPSQPKAENATPTPSIVPTQKPALSSPSVAPVQQQPTKAPPVVPESSPLATPTTPKSKPLLIPATTKTVIETIDQEKNSTVAIPTIKDTPLEATDAEIEEILQSLDAAKEDLSSIATP